MTVDGADLPAFPFCALLLLKLGVWIVLMLFIPWLREEGEIEEGGEVEEEGGGARPF